MSHQALRILILSTPKTGNTWLRNLLASIYGLPKLGLTCPFDPRQASALGDRWVLFHHYMPEPKLLDWIEQTKPVLLTTVRHPGDVLLSLYHHVNGFSKEPVCQRKLRAMLDTPYERRAIFPPATHTFQQELQCSLAWIRTGKTRTVRYEDLRLNTLGALTSLTDWIRPVDQARIEQSIERCDLGLMRSLAEGHKQFFRSGETGQWIGALDPGILSAFDREPYKSLVAELGYSFDHPGSPAAPVSESRSVRNPFRLVRKFANGAPVAPVIEDFYLSLDPALNASWPPAAETGPGSFYHWMNAPCEMRGSGLYAGLDLSRLAHYIYQIRFDVQSEFRGLAGPNRARYAEWFIHFAKGYGLDPCFIAPVNSALIRWGNQRFSQDRMRAPWWPKLPNYAVHLHGLLAELQRSFPDYLIQDRWNLLHWMAYSDYRASIPPGITGPIWADLTRCAKIRAVIEFFIARKPRRGGVL